MVCAERTTQFMRKAKPNAFIFGEPNFMPSV
jgi:hypothetical protein